MSEVKTFPIRLSKRSDSLLRENFRHHGDRSAQLATILESLDLAKIELVRFPTGRRFKDDDESLRPAFKTSIRMQVSLYEQVRRAAEIRSASINEMFNSAIQAGRSAPQ